jgi:DNA repair protein RadC
MPSYQITPVFSTKLVREGSIKTQPFSNSSDRAKAVCIEYLKDSPCERFVIVMLSTQLQVIGFAEITVGTLDASLVHPREVFRPAILANASAIIIAHNHPSTHLTPSREDKASWTPSSATTKPRYRCGSRFHHTPRESGAFQEKAWQAKTNSFDGLNPFRMIGLNT